MAVHVYCPACHAAILVNNASYLVFLRCHSCYQEFMVDAKQLSHAVEFLEPVHVSAPPVLFEGETNDAWLVSSEDAPNVLVFCPMCGEMAPESAQACSACGEYLPDDGTRSTRDPNAKQARRFRRQARVLGVLWLILAYVILPGDFWISESEIKLPPMILGGRLGIPPIPMMTMMTMTLACLGLFALAGQFWPVAVGGLLNYLILFVVVWNPSFLSVGLLAGIIVLTHAALHTAASSRSS